MGLKAGHKASTTINDSSIPGNTVKEALENIIVGAGGIPLSGTTFGNPVTGNIQFITAGVQNLCELPTHSKADGVGFSFQRLVLL